jgi:hypothetical protein
MFMFVDTKFTSAKEDTNIFAAVVNSLSGWQQPKKQVQ